jgi:hypothetical protein
VMFGGGFGEASFIRGKDKKTQVVEVKMHL